MRILPNHLNPCSWLFRSRMTANAQRKWCVLTRCCYVLDWNNRSEPISFYVQYWFVIWTRFYSHYRLTSEYPFVASPLFHWSFQHSELINYQPTQRSNAVCLMCKYGAHVNSLRGIKKSFSLSVYQEQFPLPVIHRHICMHYMALSLWIGALPNKFEFSVSVGWVPQNGSQLRIHIWIRLLELSVCTDVIHHFIRMLFWTHLLLIKLRLCSKIHMTIFVFGMVLISPRSE